MLLLGKGHDDIVKKTLLILIASLLAMNMAATANAILLFHEDFNHGHSVVDGAPTTSNGADNDWYAARFEPGHGFVRHDIGMAPRSILNPHRTGWFEDDAGILINISTEDFVDVALDFDWRTRSASHLDRFRAGYFIGDISGFNVHRVRDLTSPEDPANWDNWTHLLSGSPTRDWESASYALPSNVSSLWIGFWMDGSEDDFGLVDDIDITGQTIPEPSGLMLMGMALFGLAKIVRKGKGWV